MAKSNCLAHQEWYDEQNSITLKNSRFVVPITNYDEKICMKKQTIKRKHKN